MKKPWIDDLKNELLVIKQDTELYNGRVESIIKAINKKYKRINIEIDDQGLIDEINENDKRFVDLLKNMIRVNSTYLTKGKKEFSFLMTQYTRMVDRTASSITRKSGAYTLNFSLKRVMGQNALFIKKILNRVDEIIHEEN